MRQSTASALLAVTAITCNIDGHSLASGESTSPLQAQSSASCGCWNGSTTFTAETAGVLVFGDADRSMSKLSAMLRAIGYPVTVAPHLPEDLEAYRTIWHVGLADPLTEPEQARLVAFVQAGGGLHLTGERTQSDTMNDTLGLVVNALVTGGGVAVGRLGDTLPARGTLLDGSYDIHQQALGDIASTPNPVTKIWMTGVGRVGGIASPRNILATGAGHVPVGAIWQSSDLVCGTGALTLLMDGNWLALEKEENLLFVDNLQSFLDRHALACQDDDDGDGVPNGVDDCPDTPAGDIVDGAGCSISDLCPCDADWANHGEYTSCVAHAAEDLVAAGSMSSAEKDAIVSAAGRSDCGNTERACGAASDRQRWRPRARHRTSARQQSPPGRAHGWRHR